MFGKDFMFDSNAKSLQPFVESIGFLCIGSIAFMGAVGGLILIYSGKGTIIGPVLYLLGCWSFLREIFGIDIVRAFVRSKK